MSRKTLLTGLAMAACTPDKPTPDSGSAVYFSDDPALTGVQIECAPAAGSWRVQVRTDAWMGRARLWLGTSAEDVEQHDISLDRAAADASWDCADSTLPMAVDVLDPGAGTRFRCDDRQQLHMLLAVTNASGDLWTDCRLAGPDADLPWSDISGIPACDRALGSVFEADSYTAEEGSVSDCP
mgnify:CR=1 FL=1